MVSYKVIYFNARGPAEIIRHILVLAGQEYEDFRIPIDMWPKYKASMPFGQVPILEVDGKQIGQSYAGARYLARKFGFAGKTPFEEALVDAVADQVKDLWASIRAYYRVLIGFETGDLDQLVKDCLLPARDTKLPYISKILKQSRSGWLVGNSVTWADLVCAELIWSLLRRNPSFLDPYPEIKTHMEKVRAIPALKKWIETGPVTYF